MPDVLTAQEVGHLLMFVAPGYFARLAYRSKFPAEPSSNWDVFVFSVAASVPLVALADELRTAVWLDVQRDPLDFSYIAILLGTSLIAGYLFALARGNLRTRSALSRLGFRREPESLVFLRTVPRMPAGDAQVTITFKTGEVLAGTPKYWSDPDSPIRELFVTNPAWWDEDAPEDAPAKERWQRRDEGGVLVNLADVWSIELQDDPA